MIERNNRLLIVDDNQSIHDDFRKILTSPALDPELLSAESVLFEVEDRPTSDYVLTMALQGEEAIERTRAAMKGGKPFALAFVDIRMPPGLDGIETARHLWEIDPDLQIVICSAYSDYAWTDMTKQLGSPERWVLLKKPFENIEVLQLAAALSQKRALQQVARAAHANLEAQVAERTEKLSEALRQLEREGAERAKSEDERRSLERKLEQAQRLESLGVLAGGVAHDFNNILTGICGHASLARLDVPADCEAQQHLREIELCSRRAAELCEQMLAYAGQTHVSHADVDLNQLVNEMGGLVQASVPRDVDFQITLLDRLPAIRGDASRLRQVVMNLVINGAEALTPERRGLSLTTSVRTLTAAEIGRMTFPGDATPGAHVCIDVTDTGIGMTPETIDRIFEPFFTTKFVGRGLGLCAVLGIVRSHGGALDVKSAPGKGSAFRVYLPAIVAEAITEAGETPSANDANGSSGDVRLLVVDDEQCVREIAAAVLRGKGYAVCVAADGIEGLEHVRNAPDSVDGVVLDMTMPRMSGIAALAAMRQIRPGLPAVMITGYGKQLIAERLADSAATVALQKPFDAQQLCGAIESVLEQGKMLVAERNVA